jgi:hypothetical protein
LRSVRLLFACFFSLHMCEGFPGFGHQQIPLRDEFGELRVRVEWISNGAQHSPRAADS